MSQFDQTTEKMINSMQYSGADSDQRKLRNSTKVSMEILARAVSEMKHSWFPGYSNAGDFGGCAPWCKPCKIIAQVKANGDWPLEEKV